VDCAEVGNLNLSGVKAVAVETWLGVLPLENSSRAKIRNIMSALYSHAIRWEMTDRNQITMVRQTAKRTKHPDVLTTQEATALLRELPEPARTGVYVAVATGLRVSELLALKWSDADFAAQIMKPSRGLVGQVLGGLKTEESSKPVPASEAVTDALLARSQFVRESRWLRVPKSENGR